MLKNLTVLITVAFLLNILGCPPVEEKQDAGRQGTAVDELRCRAACDHIGPKGLNCEEGQPVEMRESCNLDAGRQCQAPATCSGSKCVVDCVTFCVDTLKTGAGIAPECVARVRKCGDIDGCRFAR